MNHNKAKVTLEIVKMRLEDTTLLPMKMMTEDLNENEFEIVNEMILILENASKKLNNIKIKGETK